MEEELLTVVVVEEDANAFEAKVLGHEFAHLVEQACEVPLTADFASKLKGVCHLLFSLIYLSPCLSLLELHRQEVTHNPHDLLVCRLETHMLISLLV